MLRLGSGGLAIQTGGPLGFKTGRVAEIVTVTVVDAAHMGFHVRESSMFSAGSPRGTGHALVMGMTHRLFSCVLVISTLVSGLPAGAQNETNACSTEPQLVVADRLYLVCGRELNVRPKGNLSVVLERRVAPTPIVGLFERGGEVFVELHEVVLRPVSTLSLIDHTVAAGGTTTILPARAVRSDRATGEVISVDDDSFLVTLGSQDGLTEGDRIAVLEYAEEEVAGQQIRAGRVLLVGQVYEVAPEYARVRLGFGETVVVGADVRWTDENVTARLINRPRNSGLSLGVSLQPFLPINDDLAFATLGDAHVTYRFDAPAYIRAAVGAFGGLVSGQGNQSIFDGWVDAGFDQQVFSLGLGVGALRTERTDYSSVDASFQPTLVQTARFGPLDGLHFSVSTRAMIRDKEVHFGSISASFWAPVHRRTTLVFNGGGGSPALYAFGNVGARFLVKGNGRSDSLFITPSVGYAAIKRFEDLGSYFASDNVGGPSLSVAVEWRP